MSDIRKPGERPPHEQIPPISRLEKDKQEKDEVAKIEKKDLIASLFAFLAECLKNFFQHFKTIEQAPKKIVTTSELSEDLKKLKTQFQLLAKEDVSHEVEFAHSLSLVWHHLLQHRNKVGAQTPEVEKSLAHLMNIISRYPGSADHGFGYYLTEFVGKEWIPFPFMNLLTQLHEEHLKNPQHSTLTKWIAAIDTLIYQLKQ